MLQKYFFFLVTSIFFVQTLLSKCTCTYALAIDIWQLDGIFFGFTILIVTTQVDEQALKIQVDEQFLKILVDKQSLKLRKTAKALSGRLLKCALLAVTGVCQTASKQAKQTTV